MQSIDSSALVKGAPSEWLVLFLSERGISIADICKALNLNPAIFEATGMVLAVDTFDQIYEWAARVLCDPDLGIHIAEQANASWFGLMGYISRNAPTLGDWFLLSARYHCLYSPEFGISFTRAGGIGEFIYQESAVPKSESRQDTSFAMALIVETVRRLGYPAWTPIKCTFTYTAPEDLTEHHRFFGQEIYFRHAHNSLQIEEELLSTPVSDADPTLLKIMTQQANMLLEKATNGHDLVRHTQFLISANIGNDALNFESLSRQLNMSVRSLHRHLKKNNTSFRALRQEAVILIAKEALVDTDTSITQIAFRLGYSEPGAFVRVFKRVVGESPLQFRKIARVPM